MRYGPIHIEELAGPVVITPRSFGGALITVGDQQIIRTRRNNYRLPRADGRLVDAKLTSSAFDLYPSIEIAGVEHRAGPKVPVLLKLMVFLPFLVFIVGFRGGLLGGLISAAAILVNIRIARGNQSTAVKVVLMLGVLGAGVIALGIIAVILQQLLNGPGQPV